MEAVEAGRLPVIVAALVCDHPGAAVLDIARSRGVEALLLDPKQYPSREAHDKAVVAALDERRVGLVCLAGYMRILSAGFVKHFEGRMLNIHPALLPAFPGLHAQRQALEHGAKVSGATVHFVDEGTDTGPIVLQTAVPVRRRRYRRDAVRAHPGRRAPHLSGGHPAVRRRAAARRGPPGPHQGDPMSRVRRALISVHDKTGVVDFAKGLAALGVEILSTGGTAKLLEGVGRRGGGRRRGHGLSRDARRSRQDPAPEGARRHPRAPGSAGALRARSSSTGSDPSTWLPSRSTPSRKPSPDRTSLSRRLSRTSTSAAPA